MFVALIVLSLLLVGMGFGPTWWGDGSKQPLFGMMSALPLAGVMTVIVQWFSNPDGIKDYTQGGVVGMKQSPSFLRWYDWGIFMTRRGTIDKDNGQLRLQRKMLFGLIPLSSVERPISEFYRVEVDVERLEQRGERHNVGLFAGTDSYIARFDYTIRLVGRSTDSVVVLDVSEGGHSAKAARFVGCLREALEDAIGVPGEGSQRKRIQSKDDYETWRRKQKEQEGGER